MSRKRKIVIGILFLFLLGICAVIICDQSIAYSAKGRLYDSIDSVPHREVGLILGTSPISMWNGRRNYYFDHRIKAGAELYKWKNRSRLGQCAGADWDTFDAAKLMIFSETVAF